MGMALAVYDVASRAVLRALFDFPDDGGLEFAAVSELQEQFAIGHAETNWITRRKVSRSVSDAIPVVATCINEGMAFHSQKGRGCIARRCQLFSNFRFGLGPILVRMAINPATLLPKFTRSPDNRLLYLGLGHSWRLCQNTHADSSHPHICIIGKSVHESRRRENSSNWVVVKVRASAIIDCLEEGIPCLSATSG
jgi:hypothetical protein